MRYKKVENEQDLIRDETNGAFIVSNSAKLQAAKKAKIEALRVKKKQETVVSDINKLKEEMSEIKSVLNKIVEKL